jgi:hypothetical protein
MAPPTPVPVEPTQAPVSLLQRLPVEPAAPPIEPTPSPLAVPLPKLPLLVDPFAVDIVSGCPHSDGQ